MKTDFDAQCEGVINAVKSAYPGEAVMLCLYRVPVVDKRILTKDRVCVVTVIDNSEGGLLKIGGLSVGAKP